MERFKEEFTLPIRSAGLHPLGFSLLQREPLGPVFVGEPSEEGTEGTRKNRREGKRLSSLVGNNYDGAVLSTDTIEAFN